MQEPGARREGNGAWVVGDDVPVTPADPDRACAHAEFITVAEITRITDDAGSDTPIAYAASIRVTCAQCGEPFRWIGLPGGVLPTQPTCDVSQTELRAPLRPASSDPDFGVGVPGFTMRVGDDGAPA